MGIEKKVAKLAQRVVKCEEIAERSRKDSVRAIEAIDIFKGTVQELIEKTKMNSDAIIEHIAQLDTEKAEIVSEYRQELGQAHKEFDNALKDLGVKLEDIKEQAEAINE